MIDHHENLLSWVLDPCKTFRRKVKNGKERGNKLNKICILLKCDNRSLRREDLCDITPGELILEILPDDNSRMTLESKIMGETIEGPWQYHVISSLLDWELRVGGRRLQNWTIDQAQLVLGWEGNCHDLTPWVVSSVRRLEPRTTPGINILASKKLRDRRARYCGRREKKEEISLHCPVHAFPNTR